MAPPTILTIDKNVRTKILEIFLVAEDKIHPKFANFSTNPTKRYLRTISLVCKQLHEEALAIFFTKNNFCFELGQSRVESRGPATLHPLFFSTLGSSPTKKLIQNLTFELFNPRPRNLQVGKDKYWRLGRNTFGWGQLPSMLGEQNARTTLQGLIDSLPLLPHIKEITVVLKVPSYFQLCEWHFKHYSEKYGGMADIHKRPKNKSEKCSGNQDKRRVDNPYPFCRSDLNRIYTLLKGLNGKAAVRVVWEFFSREDQGEDGGKPSNEEIQCDWINLQFLRAIFEMTKEGYTSGELRHWYETLEVPKEGCKSEELKLWCETMEIPGGDRNDYLYAPENS
ncbi:hypothetical protein HYFRA_00002288 [Hymenoscyphus fraxineus]|uniref:Uncharacterized protein n=1 Tax=Hymenoscyphus fraxineus TaxID=746836 RepID=A0A9N9LAX5_9HELO|nr:hypothetical protein HYFRA_00002288 [Hymenoscyphus fraxineus]